MEVNSIDGRYWAKAEFDVSGGPGMKDLILPTAYRSVLYRLGPTQLAFSATLADSCASAPALFLETSWGTAEPGEETLILVNAQPGTSVALFDRTTQRETACDKMDLADAVAYSTTCRVKIPNSASNAFILRRRHFENKLKDLPFAVAK